MEDFGPTDAAKRLGKEHVKELFRAPFLKEKG